MNAAALIGLALLSPGVGSIATAPSEAYTVTAPDLYIKGAAFTVTVSVQVADDAPVSIPAWTLSPAAFEVHGAAVGSRDDQPSLRLLPGQSLQTTFDLGPALDAVCRSTDQELVLHFGAGSVEDLHAPVLRAVPKGLDFMSMPVEQLSDYHVILQTLHGPIHVELWSDVAPNHARNFLDLAYSGFFDDSKFHRVVPGFMIQGGSAPPGRPAPRRLKNEFNDRRHLPGVLSMARMGADTRDEDGNVIPAFDSASSEFFIMHAVYPSLDGKYTAFGKVLSGMEAVEEVVESVKTGFNRRDPRTHAPRVPQTIRRAIVVKARQG